MARLFVHRSVIAAPADELFRWHEQSDALPSLMPSNRFVRIAQRAGGIRDGGMVTLAIGVGAVRFRWTLRHYGYIAGEQFRDEQVSGPFSIWRHTHRVEPIAAAQSLYEDRVEYAMPGGSLINWLIAPITQRVLARAFTRRHATVRERVEQLWRQRALPRDVSHNTGVAG